MTARLAARELRLEGSIEAFFGVVALVLAIALDAPTYWPWTLILAVVGLCATAYPARWQAKAVARVEPAPEHLRRVSTLRGVPMFIVSAALLPGLAAYAPMLLWFAAIVALDGAIVSFVRAAVIARAERRSGGRILRAHEKVFDDDQYFVAPH